MIFFFFARVYNRERVKPLKVYVYVIFLFLPQDLKAVNDAIHSIPFDSFPTTDIRLFILIVIASFLFSIGLLIITS